ncbi:acyl-CoA thioesterase [Alkalimarinus alittae]|uniref:Acyl-CoA thioesterase II n=1 Tax=Alkalimarinus alittae TaxID=2961619 RepID=A0ABY6N0P7_9ALTE|nr:acyl-CoA thioesterase II [Alkalimarinus alittae]UZE95676.1 acyl-CoA thioesterase II [Alkalimarinus alittae]
MTEVLKQLVELLQLEPLNELSFRGNSENLGFRHVFGGQVLGQALMAGCKTVEEKDAHSMHGYFLRPGDHSLPIDYEVQVVRDGATFSTRRVIARQSGTEIFAMMASFQSPEEGFDHQFDMPDAQGPEGIYSELETRRKFKEFIPEKVREQYTVDRPIEIRPIDPINYLAPETREPYKQNWFRAIADLPDDPVIHQCILAYASDFGLLGTSMLPHGVSFMGKGMQVASLDHSIWFHRDFRVDDWLLYDMDSPSASRGRGLNRGNIYNQDGILVASVCQEALIRQRK